MTSRTRSRVTSVLALVLALAPGPAVASVPPWARRETRPPVYPPALVSPEWLARRTGTRGVRIVDARPLESYRRGHIPGALHVDAAMLPADPAGLAGRLGAAGLDSSGTVVCYSDSTAPVSAGRLYWLVELAGHRDVRVLNGGLEAWTSAGRRLATGEPPATPVRYLAAPDTSRLADQGYVSAVFGESGHTLMDWRPFESWASGHVPHSLPFPLERLVDRDGAWLDSARARAVFQAFGPRANDYVNLEDEFVVCGEPGPRDAPIHPYLAARIAGIPRVRCFPGGFAEWREHPESPRVRVVGAAEVERLIAGEAPTGDGCGPPRGYILLDLRGPPDYGVGHLPGAMLVASYRFAEALEDTLRAHWPEANRAVIPLVLYCYGPDCVRSRNGATIAARHGFRNLLWFRDGTAGWLQARLPLVKGERLR